MTAPKPATKDQEEVVAQFLEISTSSPKQLE